MVPFSSEQFHENSHHFYPQRNQRKRDWLRVVKKLHDQGCFESRSPNFSWAPIQGALMLAYLLEKSFTVSVSSFLQIHPGHYRRIMPAYLTTAGHPTVEETASHYYGTIRIQSSQLTFHLLWLATIHPSNLSHFPMQISDRLKRTHLLGCIFGSAASQHESSHTIKWRGEKKQSSAWVPKCCASNSAGPPSTWLASQ